jgi:hypothetical protein
MWNVLTVTTVWYVNWPRQCGTFLLFLQFGILTVPDNTECSYCSDCVVFELSRHCGILTVPTVWYVNCPGSVVY